jgi:hypothetical protein
MEAALSRVRGGIFSRGTEGDSFVILIKLKTIN